MKDRSFLDFVLEQLAGFEYVRAKAMFGGYGLYADDVFFGIVHDGRLYFRTDDITRPQYLGAGMQPFRPNPAQTLKRYFEVPVDVLEEPDELLQWARRACATR